MIKKFTPDYFGWIFLFLINIGILTFWIYLIHDGITYEKKYRFDLTGYSYAFLAFLMLLYQIKESIIMICYLKIELGRTIIFNAENETIEIYKQTIAEKIPLSTISSIVFTISRPVTRSITGHLSYTQINFINREPLIITSFMINDKKMQKLFNNSQIDTKSRYKDIFEGIKVQNTSADTK